MKRLTTLLMILCGVLLTVPTADRAAAQADEEPPANVEVIEATEEGAETEAKVSPEVARVLEASEKARDEVDRLRAMFKYHLEQTLIGDEEWRRGTIVYKAPSKVRIEFAGPGGETYQFDGRVLVIDRPVQKQRYAHRFVKASDPPLPDLDIDRVPFPLPFGQSREKVLKIFDAVHRGTETLKPWAQKSAGEDGETEAEDRETEQEPEKKYEHLRLVPKPKSRMAQDYQRMDFWIDPDTGLPGQIRMTDTNENIETVRFSDIQTNEEVEAPDKLFDADKLPGGWSLEELDHTEP